MCVFTALAQLVCADYAYFIDYIASVVCARDRDTLQGNGF